MRNLSDPSGQGGQVWGPTGRIPIGRSFCTLPGQHGRSLGPLVEFLVAGAVYALLDQQGQGLMSACVSRRGNQCLPLEPEMVVAIHAIPWSSHRQCLVAWVHSQRNKLFWWPCPSPHTIPNNGALPLWWDQAFA